MRLRRSCGLALLAAGCALPLAAQPGFDPAAALAAQRAALAPFAALDGVWRGPAWSLREDGQRVALTQTERVGPFLDGAVRVIEGRGYAADGSVAFNAFAIISYNSASRAFSLRSYAQGRVGDFPVTPTADGYVWEIAAGPMTIRYTVTLREGVWREVGDRILPGREPVRFMEMELRRLGDTPWPAGGAVPAQ
jgi:hypothetical protein